HIKHAGVTYAVRAHVQPGTTPETGPPYRMRVDLSAFNDDPNVRVSAVIETLDENGKSTYVPEDWTGAIGPYAQLTGVPGPVIPIDTNQAIWIIVSNAHVDQDLIDKEMPIQVLAGDKGTITFDATSEIGAGPCPVFQ